MDIPNCFFRTSIKGLILDSKKQFLLCREDNGYWDLPGGGMEFGETPEAALKREINEEMGLTVTHVGKYPMYFLSFPSSKEVWTTNIIFEVSVRDLEFTPSNECEEIGFFDKQLALQENVFPSIKDFLNFFDINRHQ